MMFVHKLFTLFRAYETDATQAVIDRHAMKILEQERRDAAAGVAQATRDLTGLMAREMADRRSHEAAGEGVIVYEAYALKAPAKGDDARGRRPQAPGPGEADPGPPRVPRSCGRPSPSVSAMARTLRHRAATLPACAP